LIDQCVIDEIRKESKNLKANENENTMYQSLWDTMKVVLRGKFIVMTAYIKNQRRLKMADYR
jgi:hypothetical protein